MMEAMATDRPVNSAYQGFDLLPTEILELVIYETGALRVPSAHSLVSTCRRLRYIWHGDDRSHRNKQMSRLLAYTIGKGLLPAAMMRLAGRQMLEHILNMGHFDCDIQGGANANRVANHVGYYYSKAAQLADFGTIPWSVASKLQEADMDVSLLALQYFEDAAAFYQTPCPAMTISEFDRTRRSIYLLDHIETLRDCTECIPDSILRQNLLYMPEVAFRYGLSMLEAKQVGQIQDWLVRLVDDRLSKHMYTYRRRMCCAIGPDNCRMPCPVCDVLVTRLTSTDFANVLRIEAQHHTQSIVSGWDRSRSILATLKLWERFEIRDLQVMFNVDNGIRGLSAHALLGMVPGRMPSSYSSYPFWSTPYQFRHAALFEDADPGPYNAMRWDFDYDDKLSQALSVEDIVDAPSEEDMVDAPSDEDMADAPPQEDMPVYGVDCCRREHEPYMWDQARLRLLTGGLLPTYTLP